MTCNSVVWALFPWFKESGEHFVHPEDLVSISQFQPSGVVFKVLGSENGYIKINSGDNYFRVNEDILRIIEPQESWLFEVGETVSIRGKGTNGIIASISWHHKEKKPMYGLNVDGKLKSKRYWPEDLEKIELD